MIGAHNSLTAFRPRCILSWIVFPMWKCQTLKPESLLSKGIRFFDFRFRRKNGRWFGAHGIVTIDVDPLEQIALIASHIDKNVVIRVILERGTTEDIEEFKCVCHFLETHYPGIKFIGGNFKPTWERVYCFAQDNIHDNIIQHVGSMDSHTRWWSALLPGLWARLYNKKYLPSAKKNAERLNYFFDFITYGFE